MFTRFKCLCCSKRCGTIKVNTNPDQFSYCKYGIWFDSYLLFSLLNFYCGKNAVSLGTDSSSSVHIDNKKKDILVLGECPTQGIDYMAITVDAKYSIKCTRSKIKFC